MLTPTALRRIAGAAVALIVSWSIVFGYVVHAALPLNPIRLPLEESLHANVWAPQGWAFFTRDAREDRFFVFRRGAAGDTWQPALMSPHNKPSNAFGMDRKTRAQGVEMGLMFNAAPKQAWRSCKGDPVACLSDAPVAFQMANISPRPTLCGDVGLVLQPPVPWAWARLPHTSQMNSRVARVKAVCQ